MKKLRIVLVFLSLSFVINCSNNSDTHKNYSKAIKENDTILMSNNNELDITALKELVLEKGNTDAYNKLRIDFFDSPYDEFLNTALIMANKYNYPYAYIDVYYCLTDVSHKIYGTELDDLDEKTKKLSLKYLVEGAKLKEVECMSILANYIKEGKYFQKDEKRSERLKSEADSLFNLK